jgi:transposase
MASTIPCRKVYKFRMEPTELEALELERAASVARFVYNWALGQSKAYYQQHGKSKQWGELSADLTQLKRTELDVAGSIPVSRSTVFNGLGGIEETANERITKG